VDEACSTHGKARSIYKIPVGYTKGKNLRACCRLRWEDNIKMGIKKIVLDGVNVIYVVQNTGVKPLSSIKGGNFLH